MQTTAFCGEKHGGDLACVLQCRPAMNAKSEAPPAPAKMHNALGPLMFLIVPFVIVLAYGFLAK
jgi:hypothetical protein